MDPLSLLYAILFLPLLAAVLIAAFGRRRHNFAATLSVGASFLQMALSLWLLWGGWDETPLTARAEWLRFGDVGFQMGFLLNNTAALLLFVVSFVGFWIHLFSLGYMRDDPGKGRFFGGLSIFMFAMMGLVLADNLFMMFIFWELVGFSSYMLIAHYFGKSSAAAAADKAFIVNRVGDFGFLIGIIWCYLHFGTVDLVDLELIALNHPEQLLTPISLLLISGVLGKSAQLPLHIWLPDAMEGPTPVSALIHAATMVAAGVYLLGRIYFIYTEPALTAIIVIGAATAIYAAFCAFGTRDIKKILAYSTLSQLGFLVAAFGLGTRFGLYEDQLEGARLFGVGAANFHLTTHAFFKALLFLGAGSVIHACRHEQDIHRMGGLWKRMPLTFAFFTVAVLAISGIPPLAGFYSKDAILYMAYQESTIVFYVLVLTTLLTAFYMGRLYFVAFFGKPRSEAAENAKETSWMMWVPLAVLAVYSALGGQMFVYPPALHFLIDVSVLHPTGGDFGLMLAISVTCGVVGLALGYIIYYRSGAEEDLLERKWPRVYGFLHKAFYIDAFYQFYVRRVQQPIAEVLAILDEALFSMGLMRGSGGIAGQIGRVVRGTFTGNLHGYVYWFLAGILLFWLYAAGVIG